MRLRLGDRDRVQEPQVARLVTHRCSFAVPVRSDHPTAARLPRQNGTGVSSARDRPATGARCPGIPASCRGRRPAHLTDRGRDLLRDDRRCSRRRTTTKRRGRSGVSLPGLPATSAAVSTAVELLGAAMRAPILLAPCAFAGHAHPDGELAVARAAAAATTTYVVSTREHASRPTTLLGGAPGACWLQLYVPRDDETTGAARSRVRRTPGSVRSSSPSTRRSGRSGCTATCPISDSSIRCCERGRTRRRSIRR